MSDTARGVVVNPRILITVSRSFREWSAAREAIEKLYATYPNAVLQHGDCERGDRQIAGMWTALGGVADPMPADWAKCAPLDERADVLYRERGIPTCKPGHRKLNRRGDYCPTAGLRRDVDMVEIGPDMVLGFLDPKSRTKGAFRTCQMAEDAGIPTVRYVQREPS